MFILNKNLLKNLNEQYRMFTHSLRVYLYFTTYKWFCFPGEYGMTLKPGLKRPLKKLGWRTLLPLGPLLIVQRRKNNHLFKSKSGWWLIWGVGLERAVRMYWILSVHVFEAFLAHLLFCTILKIWNSRKENDFYAQTLIHWIINNVYWVKYSVYIFFCFHRYSTTPITCTTLLVQLQLVGLMWWYAQRCTGATSDLESEDTFSNPGRGTCMVTWTQILKGRLRYA